VVAPPEGLAAQLVAASVLIAAGQHPLEMANQIKTFLEEGRRLYEESPE
jgi:hypothetical protein